MRHWQIRKLLAAAGAGVLIPGGLAATWLAMAASAATPAATATAPGTPGAGSGPGKRAGRQDRNRAPGARGHRRVPPPQYSEPASAHQRAPRPDRTHPRTRTALKTPWGAKTVSWPLTCNIATRLPVRPRAAGKHIGGSSQADSRALLAGQLKTSAA